MPDIDWDGVISLNKVYVDEEVKNQEFLSTLITMDLDNIVSKEKN